MKIFKKSSYYYDLIYKHKNYLKETKFINRFIKRKNNKKINLLEIGCGTGGHAHQLAKYNYNITSIDPSKEMIKIAKSKPKKKNVNFYCTKFENFKNKNKFDVCVALFHVINYFSSEKKLKIFFQKCSSFLKKDGILIFDYWNGNGIENNPPIKTRKILKKKNFELTRFADPYLKKSKNQVIVKYKYTIKKIGKKISFNENHKLKYIFLKDIKFFSQRFFKIVKVGSWLNLKKPTKNTWFAYVVLKAK